MEKFLTDYWPLTVLAAWLGYKWWNARRVSAMLPALKAKGAVLIDVRGIAEYAAGNVPGTINIPLQDLGARLSEIPRGVPVVVGCASGSRSGMARLILRSKGYTPVYNIGNWRNFLS